MRLSPSSAFPVRTLLAILIGWVILHHAVFFHFDGRTLVDHDGGFLGGYYFLHQHWLEHHDLPGFFRLAGQMLLNDFYPLPNVLLATIGLVVPLDLFTVRMFQVLFFVSLILGTYVLARTVSGPRAALLAAFTVATLPLFDNFSRKTFYQFHGGAILIWAHVLVARTAGQPWGAPRAVLLGLLIALGVACHPITALLAVPVAAGFAWQVVSTARDSKDTRSALAPLAAFVVTTIVANLPFLYRFGSYATHKLTYVSGVFSDPAVSSGFAGRLKAMIGHYPLFLGKPYTVLLLISLAALTVAFLRPGKTSSALRYLLFATVFSFGVNVYTVANNVLPHDAMFLWALVPPLVAGCAPRSDGERSPAAFRWIGTGFALAVLIAGLYEKSLSLRGADSPTEVARFDNSHRRIVLIPDIYTLAADAIAARSGGRNVLIASDTIAFGDDGRATGIVPGRQAAGFVERISWFRGLPVHATPAVEAEPPDFILHVAYAGDRDEPMPESRLRESVSIVCGSGGCPDLFGVFTEMPLPGVNFHSSRAGVILIEPVSHGSR